MEQVQTDLRIGPLLKKMELLKGDQLEDLLQLNRTTDLPVGSVLVMSGEISDRILRTAVQAQSMLKDGLATEDQVVHAIQIVKKRGLTLNAALKEMRWSRDNDVKSSTLGELLSASKLVDQLKLTKALATSQSSMLPLGRVLVLTNALSRPLLLSTLDIQTKIRNGQLNRDMAISQLCSLRERIKHVEHNLSNRASTQKRGPDLRIGELLVESGIISTSDLLTALEMSVQGDQRVGETLLDLEWITEDKLNAGLELQKLVSCKVLSKEAAIRALNQMHKTNESLDKCVARETSPETKYQRDISQDEFLRLAGALTGVPVSQLVSTADRPHLLEHERMTEDLEVFDAAEEKQVTKTAETLRQAIKEGHLNLDQSMIIMSYCLRGGMNVVDAIKLLGWTVPIKL
ncbi:MAG: hypothetical protein U0103_00290 [Candidatus Obscuribacterales bacterium]